MRRLTIAFCGFCWVMMPAQLQAQGLPLRAQAKQTLRRATEFFRTRVATEGGYLWRYSEDLQTREGEGKASATTIWVQPPGTPSVGMAYLEAYEATQDRYYLEAALETADALVRGQLRSGGWDYRIEFGSDERLQYAYRVEGDKAGPRNVSTLDDDTTQSALRFLMRVDRAMEFRNGRIHEAAIYALANLLSAQYPNGAWPQRFERPPDAAKFPVKPAGYPTTWPWEYPGKQYLSHYTLNDNTMADAITTMLDAWRTYGDERYRASVERAGGFLLAAQMPEPQPAWAQQYDAYMHPAWARKFEPPAITGGESQGAMKTLLQLYRETGEGKYLEPLPRAIAYFRRSRLADGRLARFYELKSNRALYFTLDYHLTYSDADMPTHYSFKVADQMNAIEAEYEALRKSGKGGSTPAPRTQTLLATSDLETRVRSVVAALDERGRWVEDGRLRYYGDADPTRRIIDCRTFAQHIRLLSDYLSATKADGL